MRASSVLLLGLGLLGVAACAADAGGTDEDADSTDDALSSAAVASYDAVVPPETRITHGAIAVKLGAPIADGHRLSVIRSLVIDGKAARVVVDADTMLTSLVETPALEAGSAKAAFADTAYQKSLAATLKAAARNDALSHFGADALSAETAPEQFALTVDMCQSHKPWEKRLFDWVVALSDELHAPIPIGIAMTGVWAKAHSAELDQLNAWEAQGKLTITWVNHSSTHPLFCKNTSCSQATFLTEPSVDMNEEVFGLERSLLARGMMTSPLFRFPGLVHDQKRLTELQRLSLLPLDADAWIAKGEKIKNGAVVLVHGNGNEPEGITGFLKVVTTGQRASDLRSGKSKIVAPINVAPALK